MEIKEGTGVRNTEGCDKALGQIWRGTKGHTKILRNIFFEKSSYFQSWHNGSLLSRRASCPS